MDNSKVMCSLLLVFTMIFHGVESQNARRFIYDIWGDFHPNRAFYAVINAGEPPQTFYLLHDTGSSLTWFECPGANAREGFHPLYESHDNFVPGFDPSCSASCGRTIQRKANECHCEVEYYDNTFFKGLLVRDTFLLESVDGIKHLASIAFACGNLDSKSAIEPQCDGLLGLDRSVSSFPSQLKQLGLIDNHVHGHCLSRDGMGYGFFGGDLTGLRDDILWLTMIPENEENIVESATLSIEELDLNVDLKKILFDTGATYTYLVSHAYKAVYETVDENLSKSSLVSVKDGFLDCWRNDKGFISVDEVKHYLPTVTLRFAEGEIILQPEDYLIDSPSKKVCFGIQDGGTTELGDTNIIGDISMIDKLVIYDNERGAIGWSRRNCLIRDEIVGSREVKDEL